MTLKDINVHSQQPIGQKCYPPQVSILKSSIREEESRMGVDGANDHREVSSAGHPGKHSSNRARSRSPISDHTNLGGTPWKVLKGFAMRPDYQEQAWYGSLTGHEKAVLERLIAAQRALGDMRELPAPHDQDSAAGPRRAFASTTRNAREAPVYAKHKSLSPRGDPEGHATERPPASHVGVLKVPESLKGRVMENLVEQLAQSPAKKGAGKSIFRLN